MLRPCSAVVGPVLSTILVVPVCYGPSMAVGSSNYIEIGQSSNLLRTDRGTSLNVGASTQGTSRCLGSSGAVAQGTCDRCDQKTRLRGLAAACDCGRNHRAIGVPPGGGGVQVRVIYEGGPGEAGIIFKTPGHYVGP